jgi:hypothetical protein
MTRRTKILMAVFSAAIVGAAATSFASDHDDGEPTSGTAKNRNLNLSDHFAFKSPTNSAQMAIVTYTNPRSLPGHVYTLATNAHYVQHISKVATKTEVPTTKDDFAFQYDFAAPDANGVQAVTVTVIKDGTAVGTATGMTTSYTASKANTIVDNDATVGGIHFHFFVGSRADSFYFDVIRFFQVRAFLAQRFFGGAGGIGDATASIAPNCKGQNFLGGIALAGGTPENDGDDVNLFNPSSCAPDFTQHYNVTAITTNVDISALGGGTVFDSWSTISLLQ